MRAVYRFWHNKSAKGRIGYIGKDTKYPRRARLSLSARKGCIKLYEALKKYPTNVWKIEVLASGFRTNAALNKAEIFYIKKFGSVENGYNITKGGDGGLGWQKGRKHSEQTKKKLSLINRGQSHPKWGKRDSPKTRAKKSDAAKGNRGNLGKHFSTQHKESIRNAQRSAWARYSIKQRGERSRAMSQGWSLRKMMLRRISG